ncbi:hypothetical protein CRM22_007412 [Opisthorchis felineus]|uniref:Cleavage and polyadenylation specificity factor subunit 6 n=1 Tax=Opisthorchis felineus TaxID=147828 RepID=A0A4S2LI57_OPIFE|nr:hypothetical protein CRM22_007412 [Opisthorchis felineus]TGZ62476.1 hypothetical protein CRM22_007412 [Opisthorchis felineus]
MAGDGAAEIDLYDNIDEDFVQECADLNELYDDVMAPGAQNNTASKPESPVVTKSTLTTVASHSGKRVETYVGNLTWWTTDQDLLETTNALGINDVVEIKFHENRQNGQSKGFCVMVFGSDQSARTAMEKLPKTEIHGQNPVVTHCTKHNLSIFEKAAGGDGQPTTRSRSDESYSGKLTGLSSSSGSTTSTKLPPPLMSTPTMPASLGFSLRSNTSLMGQAAPSLRQVANALPNAFQAFAQSVQSGLPGGGHLGQLTLNLPTATSVLMTPTVPPPPLPGNASGLLPAAFSLASAIPNNLTSGAAHINPNFLHQPASLPSGTLPTPVPAPAALMQLGNASAQQSVRPQFDNYGRPVIHTYTPSSSGKLSESEFEDILQRNKTVSSSAINRAVQDAASGDYASAIETLVTAISLIKQSKIANDDRCRILINSLQDTLHGIESKSYGTKSSSRRRRRSYSDSGSEGGMDDYGGSSRRHRERGNRSRSRDRSDRHDRHRRSRDRTSGTSNSYYGAQSGASHTGGSGLSSGVSISSLGGSGQGNLGSASSGGSDRYRDSRYRH